MEHKIFVEVYWGTLERYGKNKEQHNLTGETMMIKIINNIVVTLSLLVLRQFHNCFKLFRFCVNLLTFCQSIFLAFTSSLVSLLVTILRCFSSPCICSPFSHRLHSSCQKEKEVKNWNTIWVERREKKKHNTRNTSIVVTTHKMKGNAKQNKRETGKN